MSSPLLQLENRHLGTMIADLILMITGGVFFLGGNKVGFQGESPTEIILMFLAVICVVPWYMGYLFQYFQSYSKTFQLIIKWTFGIIILALVIFLVISFMPLIEEKKEPTSAENFIMAFGMFFLVLGPMMIIGGYVDGQSIDSSRDRTKPYLNPAYTVVMGIVTLSILYLILIVGWFDPHWEGNVSFLVILLAFFLGPLAAILTFLPIIIFGKWLAKVDTLRVLPHLVFFALPIITFNVMIWWNDIVLFNLSGLWQNGHPSVGQIIWSMILAGIIPFRIIMLLKPPFKWTGLFFGLIAIGLYIAGVLYQYDAL